MKAALDALSTRRVLLFGGKGGVGKTTISALAALHYSTSRRTILFTTDPAGNLEDLFTGNRQPATGNLTIESLDANQLYSRFLKQNLDQFVEIADRGTYLDKEEIRRFFELSLPGIDELMAWMRIGELAETNANAMIVVDTAPTGHALRMLGAGLHFHDLGAALEAMEAKHRGMVRQFARRDVRDAVDAFIDDFTAQSQRRRALLNDAATTAFVPVFLSEDWVVEQTKRLIGEVRGSGMDVPLAILNRAVLEPDCDRDRQRQTRDARAEKALAPLRVERAARSCVPLDSVKALLAYLSGAPVSSPAVRVAHGAAAARRRRVAGEDTGAPLSSQSPLQLPKARILFFAGKGGVGKTTCSSSVALQFAQASPAEKFTLLSVDPAHSVRDVFAREKPPPNLAVETIDTREKWRRFRETLGEEIERAVSAIAPGGMTVAYDSEAMQKLVEIAPPGADELFAITRIADLIADAQQTRIIIDTAPTGHFLRLLELPNTAAEWVREFMRILLRYRDLIPAGSLGEELVQASRSLKLVDETLHSERAAVIVVTRPERIVVAETKRLMQALTQRKIRVASVIANYVTPENDCRCDRSTRSHELAALHDLGTEPVMIPRRDEPVTAMDALLSLVPLH